MCVWDKRNIDSCAFECKCYDMVRRRWLKTWDVLEEKERTMDVIKRYVEVNDDVENETFNNKIATTPTHIANCFTKQFTNTVKYATHKTNIHINRATHNIQGYNITLTTSQVQEAIKQSKNNNSQRS